MYFLSLLKMPYFHTRNIRSFNPNLDGTMPSQNLVPVDGPALEEALAADNLSLEEALTSTYDWVIEATLTPMDDTGLKETVPTREDPVVVATLPPTDGPGLGEEEVCFEVYFWKRARREA